MNTSSETQEKQAQSLDFSGLILGFSSAALYHIGQAEIENKKTEKPNFELAQQNVEIIKMLQEKTQGNLSTSESQLLETVLKDLRDKLEQAQKP